MVTKKSKLKGGFPGGPKINGPWEVVSLLYISPQGEFRVGQAQPKNAQVIYPKQLVNASIKGAPAIILSYKEKKTKRKWHSVASGWKAVYNPASAYFLNSRHQASQQGQWLSFKGLFGLGFYLI